MRHRALLVALTIMAGGFVAAPATAQEQEPVPPGVPAWNWQQMLRSPAAVWVCKKRVERRGDAQWRVNVVALSKETEWQVSASARLVRHPRKRTLDDWSSGVLDPGERSKVGRVFGDVDSNDRLTIGAGHRNGPYDGMGLGDTIAIRDINRC